MDGYILIFFLFIIIHNNGTLITKLRKSVDCNCIGEITYMYCAVVIHRIGAQQSIVIVHLLQEVARHAQNFQFHAGSR